MAQDFYSAFKLGPDERKIATIDTSGVALAAIQGLNEKLERKEAQLIVQQARIQSLEMELKEIKAILAGR
jgi:hypothetical protein